MKYAIVSGGIISFKAGTMKKYLSEYDHKTPMVSWESMNGIVSCTSADNFIEGTREELEEILKAQEAAFDQDLISIFIKYPQATLDEKEIMLYMLQDGYDVEEVTLEEAQRILKKCLDYYDVCNSLEEAYMEAVH